MTIDTPTYPDSRALLKEDKIFFDHLFSSDYVEISEFTFTNLYCWRHFYNFTISFLDGYYLLSSDKEARMFFLPLKFPLAKEDFGNIVRVLKVPFIRIPENFSRYLSQDLRIRIMLDRDNSDYVYHVKDLVELKGNRFDGKRNLIKNFKSTFQYEYLPIDNDMLLRECFQFEDTWCMIKDCDHVEGLSGERSAFREMLANFFYFDLRGAVIKVANEVVSVVVAQALNVDTLVLHVLKAKQEMAGLYQVMLNEFVSREAGAFTYINMEQDLGVEGLRRSKLSYHPVKMINKYSIRTV